MTAALRMAERHKPTAQQRRRAVVTAVVLAATVAAIYLTFILKFAR